MRKRKQERENKLCGSFSVSIKEKEGNYNPSSFFLFDGNAVKQFSNGEKFLRYLIEESVEIENLPVYISYNLARVFIPLRFCFVQLAEVFNIEVLAKNSLDLLCITIKKGNKNILKLLGVSSLVNCQLSELPERMELDISFSHGEEKNSALETVVLYKYVKSIFENSDIFKEELLGKTIYTQTSLARVKDKFYFDRDIDGLNPYQGYKFWCVQEQKPHNTTIDNSVLFDFAYTQQAVNRGGIAFNSIRNAFTMNDNCISIDANSMHHSCINCHYYPERFKPITDYYEAQKAVNYIIETPLEEVLERFYKPFSFAFNAQFRLENLRLKNGSIFERDEIGILSEDRFYSFIDNYTIETSTEKRNSLIEYGYIDTVEIPCFAGSKLISCVSCSLWLTEIELWNISQVYDFDLCEIMQGYYTCSFMRSPDYAILSSINGYKHKQEVKRIVKAYKGQKIETNIELPKDIKTGLENGTLSYNRLENYYKHEVKAMFNSLYGRMATDENKPKYLFDIESGNFITDVCSDPFSFEVAKRPKVNLSFGSRIVGYSRFHMVIAILLLSMNKNASFICGDTDSLIINGISKEQILDLLEPMHKKLKYSFNLCTARIKKYYPEYFYEIENLGFFEVEKENIKVMATWPKTRAEIDESNNIKVVASGLMQPAEEPNLTGFIKWLAEKEGLAYACLFALGFNKTYKNPIILNYQNTIIPDMETEQGIGTELIPYTIGDLTKKQNKNTYNYLKHDNRVDLIEQFTNTEICYNNSLCSYSINKSLEG